MKIKPVYLGEYYVDINSTPFKDYQAKDWALYFIERYGQIDGGHHKQWVLDQVTRILLGSDIVVKLAEWDNGQKEFRVSVKGESQSYKDWVEKQLGPKNSDGEYEYEYDCGIAP